MLAQEAPKITSNATIVLTEVQQVFCQITRYPLDILTPQADLEEDLGIDSVKLGEIFSVLREQYHLPPITELDIPPEQLRTIADITQAISKYVVPNGNSSFGYGTTHPASTPNVTPILSLNDSSSLVQIQAAPVSVTPTASSASNATIVLTEVQQVFCQITRYPLDILTPQADLEEDLGIDSVKLGEIFSVLREQYHLPPITELDIPPEQLRTIADITQAISKYVVPNGNSSFGYGTTHPASTPNVTPILSLNDSSSLVQIQAAPSQKPSANGNGLASSFTTFEEPLKPLDNKIALVTGSGRGLGKVIAQHLAKQGATVIVNSFHSRESGEETAAEIRATGGKAIHVWGSVANEMQLHELFNVIEAEFGVLDFFISNASNGLLARLEDIKVEHLEKAFQTNVIGLHQGALHAVKLMQKRGRGKIITLSTNAAHRYIPYFGCMAVVKAAIEALTRYLAIELAPYNIQVNCVSSGPVYGDLINKWPENEKLIPYWESISLGKKLCAPEDVASMVTYLLKEEVKQINGSILLIDAGQSIHM